MNRFHLAWAFSALFVVACGDSTSTPTDTVAGDTHTTDTTTTDTFAGDTTTNPTTSAITGVSTAGVTCTEPTPTGCTDTLVAGGGFTYPWCGLNIPASKSASGAAYDFTCDTCPSGIPGLSGMYRVYGFEDNGNGAASVDLPDPAQYAETLYVDGNTFRIHVRDAQGGPVTEAEYAGWFLCTDKGELTNRHLFWVITDVSISGLDAAVGQVFESDFLNSLSDTSGVNIAWFTSDKLAVANNSCTAAAPCPTWSYCKIGSTLSGKECYDPFAN